MIDFLGRFSTTFNEWLNKINSTNAKAVGTIGLYFLTYFLYAAAVLLVKPIDNVAFGMWLGFLAGLGGFSLAQFTKQRVTDYGAMERQAAIERAKASAGPSTVVSSSDTKVSGSPVTIETQEPKP